MRKSLRLAVTALMLATPLVSRAGYGDARWGMRLADVKRLYPAGKTVTHPSQEEMYRVVLRAFGVAPAVATFGFHPLHELNVVVFEFPDSQPNASQADYPRPSVDRARKLRRQLALALTTTYGKPTHERAGVGGSIMVWRGRDEFVRMQAVAMPDNKEDVRLWVETKREGVRATDRQEMLEWPSNHTDPSAWSETGAMDVRWGMGLGDVLEKYPDLSTTSFADNATKTFSTDTFIEAPVRLYFTFFAGKLCQLDFSQFSHSENDLGKMNDEQLKIFEDGVEYWRTKIQKILTEKYGPPIDEPSEADLAAAIKEEGFSDVGWRWMHKDMGITYLRRNARVQVLRYENIGPLGRAAYEAEVASKAAEDAKRNAKF